MDDKQDEAWNRIERKLGPAECDCDGTCELAYTLAGQVRHYRDIWEKIDDLHYPECPTAIAAKSRLKSTCCMCGPLEKAREAEECLRCHQLAEICKCGERAQLI